MSGFMYVYLITMRSIVIFYSEIFFHLIPCLLSITYMVSLNIEDDLRSALSLLFCECGS